MEEVLQESEKQHRPKDNTPPENAGDIVMEDATADTKEPVNEPSEKIDVSLIITPKDDDQQYEYWEDSDYDEKSDFGDFSPWRSKRRTRRGPEPWTRVILTSKLYVIDLDCDIDLELMKLYGATLEDKQLTKLLQLRPPQQPVERCYFQRLLYDYYHEPIMYKKFEGALCHLLVGKPLM